MKINIRNLLLILILLVFSSCASVNTKYHLVKNKKPRRSTLGFSVTPPPGEDWYEKLKNDSLYYLKIGKSSKSYYILTEAREIRLDHAFAGPDEFLSHVKNEKDVSIAKESNSNRQTSYLIENTLSDYCVRYQLNYQEHDLKGLRGRRHVEVNTGGLYCIHPEDQRVGIDVSYVEKSFSDIETISYRDEGEMFLASLNLLHK